MKGLYLFDGPVVDYNDRVICNNWKCHKHASSIRQAVLLFKKEYKKQHPTCSYVVIKDKYITKVNNKKLEKADVFKYNEDDGCWYDAAGELVADSDLKDYE